MGKLMREMQETTKEFHNLTHSIQALPVALRAPQTEFAAIIPPTIYARTLINVTGDAGGAAGNITLLSRIANKVRKIVGGYIRQTGGAARNFQIQHFDGTNARPVSDNDSGSKVIAGTLHLLDAANEVTRINEEAAANQSTYQGVLYHEDTGFGEIT